PFSARRRPSHAPRCPCRYRNLRLPGTQSLPTENLAAAGRVASPPRLLRLDEIDVEREMIVCTRHPPLGRDEVEQTVDVEDRPDQLGPKMADAAVVVGVVEHQQFDQFAVDDGPLFVAKVPTRPRLDSGSRVDARADRFQISLADSAALLVVIF